MRRGGPGRLWSRPSLGGVSVPLSLLPLPPLLPPPPLLLLLVYYSPKTLHNSGLTPASLCHSLSGVWVTLLRAVVRVGRKNRLLAASSDPAPAEWGWSGPWRAELNYSPNLSAPRPFGCLYPPPGCGGIGWGGVARVLVAERWGDVRSGFQSQPTLQLVLLPGCRWAPHLP